MRSLVLFCAALFMGPSSHAAPVRFPESCKVAVARLFPNWQSPRPDPEVLAWAKKKAVNPVVTSGDFDGDGRRDWAALGLVDGKRKVMVCLGGTVVVHADDDGCSDMIYTIRRKTVVRNLDLGTNETLVTDAAATSCFEKSGRVFLLQNQAFRVFFNSD